MNIFHPQEIVSVLSGGHHVLSRCSRRGRSTRDEFDVALVFDTAPLYANRIQRVIDAEPLAVVDRLGRPRDVIVRM